MIICIWRYVTFQCLHICFLLKGKRKRVQWFLFLKISDFGLIKWEEFSSKTQFAEILTARRNTNYIPPETFAQNQEPPGTKFDVYRWEFASEFQTLETWNVFICKWNKHPIILTLQLFYNHVGNSHTTAVISRYVLFPILHMRKNIAWALKLIIRNCFARR